MTAKASYSIDTERYCIYTILTCKILFLLIKVAILTRTFSIVKSFVIVSAHSGSIYSPPNLVFTGGRVLGKNTTG
jgi:hypothetical protein